jgi:peptidoglycan/LPS O-acetylase OafA/YrhL
MPFPFAHRWLAATPPSTAPVEPDLSRHVPALDAIRGLAILAVTFFRFGGGSPGPATVGEAVIPGIELGSRGVDLFFVLSGFLITGILFDAKSKPRYFTNFYARRTVRIFPLYYGVLALVLVGVPLAYGSVAWLDPAAEHSPWLWFYGTNVLQAWRGDWPLGWFNHFWSLAVEEHFYLVWPAVIFTLSRKNAMRACIACFVAAAVGRVAWLKLGGNNVAPEVFTLFRMDALVAGAWLALAARGEGGLLRYVSIARAAFVSATLLLVPISILHLRLLTLVDTLWVIACASLLVLVVTASPGALLGRLGNSPLLHWLGKYSYGMYVFANLLIPSMASLVTAAGLAASLGSPLAGQLCYAAIMSVLTGLLAVASWHLYEKHFLKLKRHFEGHLPRRSGRLASTPSALHA